MAKHIGHTYTGIRTKKKTRQGQSIHTKYGKKSVGPGGSTASKHYKKRPKRQGNTHR